MLKRPEMKKTPYFIVLLLLIVTGCGTYQTLDLQRLTIGMNKEQVRHTIGSPSRILVVNDTNEGYQEILEYRTGRNEVYALEFWNDYLTGYEYLYEDVTYYPPITPPLYYPEYGRPVVVHPPGNVPPVSSRPDKSTVNRRRSVYQQQENNRNGENNNRQNENSNRPGTTTSGSSSNTRRSN